MNHFDTPFQRWLEENEAHPHFREWVAGQSPQEFWATCERSDWMLWLYRKHNPDKRTCVQLALAFAERVEHLMSYEAKKCLRLVRMWLDDPESVSAQELRDSAAAADAPAFVAKNAAAALTALAAESAAAADADNYITKRVAGLRAAFSCDSAALHAAAAASLHAAAAAGLYAAVAAAAAAAHAAAHAAERKTQADIIRQHIPECPLVLRDLGEPCPTLAAPKRVGAFSVQERFVPLIRKGIKTTTIRAERKDGARPYVGDVLPIYAKMRTAQCYWVADVRVEESLACYAISEGMAFPELRLTQTWHALYQQEGFASAEEMRAWFDEHHPKGLNGWMCGWELVRVPPPMPGESI